MKKQTPLAAYCQPDRLEAGCDEAGRGCLAGPVVAAAVILPTDFDHPLLRDSKQLSEAQRLVLQPIIEQKAVAWQVAFASVDEIDQINILHASFLAMHRAIDGLQPPPQWLLIDGNRFNRHPDIPHSCIVKGDSKFRSIAAASILAKTYRDNYMKKLATQHPQYGWQQNVGYPTKAHRAAIAQFGPTAYHRQSFKLLPDNQPRLF